MMRNMRLQVLMILFLGIFCLFGGCTQDATQTIEAPPDGGISEITPYSADQRSNFEEARAELELANARGLLNTDNMTIHHINGVNVDINGSAESWVLGVARGENFSLLIFNSRNGWREEPWPFPLEEQALLIDLVLSPTDLYAHQQDLIMREMIAQNVSASDLELNENTYTVLIRSSTNISILMFNAETGELVS